MSSEALLATWELKKKDLNSLEKLLLLSLARRAGEDHTCWPSLKRIEDDTGMDRKTIIQYRQNLIDRGLLAYTGEMKGRTRLIPVMLLRYVIEWEQKRNSPRLKDEEESVDKSQPNSTVDGTANSTVDGTVKQYRGRDTEASKKEDIQGSKVHRPAEPSFKTHCPESVEQILSKEAIELAAQKKLNMLAVLAKFKTYAKSKNWMSNDWKMDFLKWITKEREAAMPQAANQAPAERRSTEQFWGPGHPGWESLNGATSNG